MEIDEIEDGAALVISPRGRLDAQAADTFEHRLLERIDAGARWIVLDAAHLEFISSAGLRALLRAAKRIDHTGGRLVLCALAGGVRDVVQLSRLDTVLEVFPDLASALASHG